MRRLAPVAAALTAMLALLSLISERWIERRWPPAGRFVEVDGLRLHCVAAGDGPGVLLVHGASGNLRDLASSLMPDLARDHRVVACDRPGHGYSQRGDDWPDPGRIAALLLDAAAQLEADRPVIVGHSWAGSVVMASLVLHAERVRGGVLLAGAAGHWVGSTGWTHALAASPVVGSLFAHTLLLPVGWWLLPGLAAQVHEPNPMPPDYLDRTGAALALRPRSFLHNGEDMARLSPYLQRLSAHYRRITRPLLAIHGDADRLVPFWNHAGRLVGIVGGLRVLCLRGVGHAPHHAAPAQVAGAIRAFSGDPDAVGDPALATCGALPALDAK